MGDALLDELDWRGQIAQVTDRAALEAALASGPLTLYAGFDPTAESLHVGNLVPIMLLRRFQLAGHRPLALVGGATGLVGDPSGRSTERTLADGAVVAERVERIKGQLARFLTFGDGPSDAVVVNNLDWTSELSAIDFLRNVGKHFSVNQMLGKESVSARLEGGGISFTEFSYMLLQAHDFLALHRRHGCALQVGGSDQWGNITAGLDLLRKVDGVGGHALTAPLITNASGTKFGKSEGGGSVWLDPAMTSPYAFYQWWLNTDDRDVVGHLRTFTFRSRDQTDALAEAVTERPQAREAQRALAEDLTALVHGPEQLARAKAASEALFGRSALEDLDEAALAAALAETVLVTVGPGPLPTVVELLADTGLVESRSAARRVVREGGAYLNNQKVSDIAAGPGETDLLHGRFLVLRRGRQKVAGVERRP